jgi:hypothetical protein
MKETNINNEEGRKKAKKVCLETICEETIELRRTKRYNLIFLKAKELGRKLIRLFKTLTSRNLKGI